jgi:ATP-dependent Clp protease protease subunit
MDASLLNHRIVFLRGPIDSESANDMIQQMIFLNAKDPKDTIDLYINSPGGAVSDGLAIIDAMFCIKAPIRTICIGRACSMAAWILAAGTRGERYATPNAEILLHQMASTIVERQQTSHLHSYAGHIIRLQKRLIQLLSKWTGKAEKKIGRDIEVELFLTADEAKDYGLVDHIMEYQK